MNSTCSAVRRGRLFRRQETVRIITQRRLRVVPSGVGLGHVPPILEAFADDLGGFTHGWQDVLRGEYVLQDPLDPPLPAKALRDQKDACLERMKEGARWRDRVLAVDDGEGNDMEETTQLPCEPSLVLGQTLFQLYMQLAVTVCASDACATRRHAPPHYKRARRELWRLAAPRLQDAYENRVERSLGDGSVVCVGRCVFA